MRALAQELVREVTEQPALIGEAGLQALVCATAEKIYAPITQVEAS